MTDREYAKYAQEKLETDCKVDMAFLKRAIEVLSNYEDCRNELCNSCGRFVESHLGACDDCRWRDK